MKKLAIIFVSLFLLASFAAADITVDDYTFTIARGDTIAQERSVTNNIDENVDIEFTATILSNTDDSFDGISINPDSLTIIGLDNDKLELSVTVPMEKPPGIYTAELNYNSDNGTDVTSGTTTVTVTVTNVAPEITTIANDNVIVGNTYSYQVVASDVESDTLAYSLSQAPVGMTISATGYINEWIAINAGTNTVTVEVSDGFDTTTESYTITAQNDIPVITLGVDSILFGDSNEARGNTIVQTISVENTGIQNLNNLQVELFSTSGAALNANFVGGVAINKNSLTVGETAIVTISITIPLDQDSQQKTIGRVTVTADGTSTTTSDTANIQMEAKSYLRITDVEIDVEGDDENIDDGDNYDEIKEGDEVKVTVTIENRYSDDDNVEIENVYFEIESDENDWDIDEESDEEDIKEDDDFDFEVSFIIGDDIDEDETDVTIRVYGDDEDEDFEHYDELTFSFEIDRVKDEITIIYMEWNKQSYTCNDDYAELEIKYKNTGTKDQDEVTLEVVSDDLDWHKRIRDIELDEGDSETETFKIPLSKADGHDEYFVDIEVFVDNDDETDSDVAVLTVSCANSNTGNTNTGGLTVPDGAYRPTSPIVPEDNVVIVLPTENENNGNIVYGEPVGAFDDFRDSNLYIILLIAVIVFILGGIFMLGGRLLNKK